MNIPKDFINSLNISADYDNFSEEVQILKETTAGTMALYTVVNKNSVTFQQVPGQPGLVNRGFMGFVNGDRSRPIMLSGSVKINETESIDNTGADQINDGGGGRGSNAGTVDLTPSVAYDVELTATVAGLPPSTEIKTYYIIVG